MTTFTHLIKTTALGAVLAASGSLANAADFSAIPSGDYSVDPTHAYINFQYNHLGLSNPTLTFDDFDVNLNLNAEDPTQSTITVTIDTNSIVTGSDIFKEHLTGDSWLDTANNPQAVFKSTSIKPSGDTTYTVTGDLTLKGETSPITLEVNINGAANHPMSGKPTVGISATGNLLRSDFGLGKYAPNISDEVALHIEAELNQAK